VSKRHQSSRRKAYGRRQHELHERPDRRHLPERIEFAFDDLDRAPAADPLAFLDPRSPRLRYSLGD
jgi:hypothetical protein